MLIRNDELDFYSPPYVVAYFICWYNLWVHLFIKNFSQTAHHQIEPLHTNQFHTLSLHLFAIKHKVDHDVAYRMSNSYKSTKHSGTRLHVEYIKTILFPGAHIKNVELIGSPIGGSADLTVCHISKRADLYTAHTSKRLSQTKSTLSLKWSSFFGLGRYFTHWLP